jgi:hypothetical protein
MTMAFVEDVLADPSCSNKLMFAVLTAVLAYRGWMTPPVKDVHENCDVLQAAFERLADPIDFPVVLMTATPDETICRWLHWRTPQKER